MTKVIPFLILVWLAGCQFGRLIGIEPRSPSVKLQSLTVSSIKGSDVTLDLGFRIANPNFFGAELKAVRYQVFCENILLAEGLNESTLKIEGEESKVFNIPLKILGENTAGILKPLFLTGKLPELRYEIRAKVTTVFGDLEMNKDGKWSP